MLRKLIRRLGADRAEELVVTLATRVPRWVVAVLGVAGAGFGVLFLAMPARFSAASDLHILLAVAPTPVWAALFLVLGSALATAAVIDHTRSHLLCLLMSGLLSLLGGLMAAGTVVGTGTGIGPYAIIILGIICLFSAITAKAYPRLRELIHDQATPADQS